MASFYVMCSLSRWSVIDIKLGRCLIPKSLAIFAIANPGLQVAGRSTKYRLSKQIRYSSRQITRLGGGFFGREGNRRRNSFLGR